MKEIVVASNNQHKIKELKQMLEPLGYQVYGMKEKGIELDVEETGTTFEENALLKAKAIRQQVDSIIISDDSGIEIACLNNAPGIYSARYLGENTPYTEKNKILLDKIKDETNREARFYSAIALLIGEEEYLFSGILNGTIAYEAKGEYGFGYDPIFYLPELNLHLAELPDEEKNKISHRHLALKQVVDFLEKRMK